MTVDVLGPLEVDAELRPRERALLAALVAKAGQVVTPGELAAAYWGADAPQTWWQQIKTGVTAIRARLGASVIITHRTGYSLGVDPSSIDAVRFERLVTAARAHAVEGADDRAVDAFTRALALWRGPALPELQQWQPAHSEAQRWEELRGDAEEELLEARLRCGETREVVPAAESLVRSAPLRENRWAIFALALYRSDRQAEALGVLRAARRRLLEELGVEPGDKLRALETAILMQDAALATPTPSAAASDLCPYQGLRVFDTDSADRFFGRDHEILDVVGRVRPKHLTVVAGASGTGKSSFVRAGVVPEIEAGGRAVQILGAQPQVTLTQLLAAFPETDVVVVDQFEEVLRCEPELRDRIDRALADVLDAGLAVLLTVRSDFLDDAVRLTALGELFAQSIFLLGPLSPNGMRAAIEQPARNAGLRLEQGLTELMLRDAGDHPSALPHLSYALVETWVRREGATLTVQGYEASGGLEAAISQAAEQRFQSFQIRERELCQSLFLRLFEPGSHGSATQRRIPLSPLLTDDRRRHVIEELVRARLCATDGDSLVVAHEAVARAWPRLRSWLDEDALEAQLLRELEEASRSWEQAGRTDDDLFRGARLHAAITWRDSSEPDITASEQEFLDASAAREQAEITALAERARTEQRLNRRLRWALAGAGVLLTGALVSTSIAVVRGSDAVRAEADALTEALAATSQSLVSSDRDVAALLAAELHRRAPDDPRARSAMLAVAAATDSPTTKTVFPDDALIFGAPIPGTDLMLVSQTTIPASEDVPLARLSVINAVTGEVVRELPAQLPSAGTFTRGTIVFSQSGDIAVVVTPTQQNGEFPGCCGAVISTVDMISGEVVATLQADQIEPLAGAVFTPRGEIVVRSHGPADLVWLDPRTLETVGQSADARRLGLPLGIPALLEGGQLAVGWEDEIEVYDATTRGLVRTMPMPSDVASFALTSVPGGLIATGPEGTAFVGTQGALEWIKLTRTGLDCFQAVLLPGGETFLCPGRTTLELRVSDGTPTGRSFGAQAEWVVSGSILADGSVVVVNQRTTAFLLRFALDGSGPLSRPIARGMIAADGFADDKTIVVTERGDDPLNDHDQPHVLWDVVTDAAVGPPSAAIGVVDRDVVARWSPLSPTPVLSDVAGSRSWTLGGVVLDVAEEVMPVSGGTGGRAFAIVGDGIVPFDPQTGQESGIPLLFNGDAMVYIRVVVNEIPGQDRAVVSWWSIEEAQMITAVFDLLTGAELARGLYGDSASVALPDGNIISTTSSRMRRSTADLEPLDNLAKPVGGANQFELSEDGTLVLLQGAGQPAALYDTATGTKLGSEITTDSPYWESAHLSPDGRSLVTNTAGGILLWDLDPDSFQEAACRLAGRDMTAAEWRRYVGDGPQVALCGF